MWTRKTLSTKDEQLRAYDRKVLRSAFVSLFWGVISNRRKHGEFTLASLGRRINKDKSQISRWFSGDYPNWEVDTISDIAWALDLDIWIQARDRKTGIIYTPAGASNTTVVVTGSDLAHLGPSGMSMPDDQDGSFIGSASDDRARMEPATVAA